MMTNFSFNQSAMSEEEEIFTIFYDELENVTMDDDIPHPCRIWFYATDIKSVFIFIFIYVACMLGLLGNGSVIWLLGFHMKRNPVTIYILNLAVADFGVLIFVILSAAALFIATNCIDISVTLAAFWMLSLFMFSTSQFLLTAISTDRCLSVLFPLWYRCHRPENLSTILCTLIWIFCFLVHGICDTLHFLRYEFVHFYLGNAFILFYVFLVNAVVCLPLVTVSSLILFIRFCFKSQQRRRKKLLTAILLALLFFLFLAFPLNVLFLIIFNPLTSYDDHLVIYYNLSVGFLCASLNSCVNPLIYFLVGRKKRGLCRENLKLVLQRVFKQEEEVYGEELQPSVQPQVPA